MKGAVPAKRRPDDAKIRQTPIDTSFPSRRLCRPFWKDVSTSHAPYSAGFHAISNFLNNLNANDRKPLSISDSRCKHPSARMLAPRGVDDGDKAQAVQARMPWQPNPNISASTTSTTVPPLWTFATTSDRFWRPAADCSLRCFCASFFFSRSACTREAIARRSPR
ncbi:hypothetical protein DPSP01_012468 [Paraphaeosphaeria sporulosa]